MKRFVAQLQNFLTKERDGRLICLYKGANQRDASYVRGIKYKVALICLHFLVNPSGNTEGENLFQGESKEGTTEKELVGKIYVRSFWVFPGVFEFFF